MVANYLSPVVPTEGSSAADLAPFYPSEVRQIDKLIRAALMQPTVCQRLLKFDKDLCNEFDIAPHTWERLAALSANTLSELCHEIMLRKAGNRL